MAIIERQIARAALDATVRAYQSGRQPDLEEIGAAVQKVTEGSSGAPTMKVRQQKRKRLFNIGDFNETMSEIGFDLEILYEELVGIISASLRRLNFTEVSYRAQSQQLEDIISTLNNLLFTIENADDNFFGVFDNFESLGKVNVSETTAGAIDLLEKVALLPANNRVGTKISLSHLYNRSTWPVQVTSASRVIRNSSGQGAGFGNAFSDVQSVWRQDVFLDQPAPVEMTFDFQLSAVEDQELSINRIQVIPHGSKPMKVKVQYSVDGINFLLLRGADSGLLMERQAKAYNFDFSTTRVEQLRFVVTRDDYDEQTQNNEFRYSFGFAHIGVYSIGRQETAQVTSKVLVPAGMTGPIDKVSMRVLEQVPPQTNIQYLIALADDNGDPIGDYRAITPLSRTTGIAPSVLRFGASSSRSIPITAESGPTISTETYRATSFYSLPLGVQSPDQIIYGTGKLFRGYGAWNRNVKQDRVLKQIKDSYITFNASDIQNLYAVVTEESAPEEAYQTFPGGGQSDVLQTALRVQHNVDYNSLTMPLTPPAGIDTVVDQRPNYAIYRILRFRSVMQIENESVQLPGEQMILLGEANPEVGLDDRPVVENTSETVTYTEGIDYVVGQDANGRPNGKIGRLASGSIGDNDIVYVSYTLNPDITHLADAARDNLIFLSTLLDIDEDDRFDVTYRFVPKAVANTVIKSTVHVTQKYGDSVEGEIYKEGPDYNINVQQGTITRVPSGSIGPSIGGDISAYVDFFYYETPDDIETYSTWVFQPRRAPVKFNFAPLALNKKRGERFIMNLSQGAVDLTNDTETPEVPFGWHQIIVRSLKPETFGNAAILKIIKLVDTDNDRVFVRNGKYFGEIHANRSPMKQVTLDFLKNSVVPTNHDNFAVNDSGQVIVNFQPGTTSELYLMQVRYDPDNAAAEADGFVVSTYPEEFLFEYRFQVDDEVQSNKVLMRAIFTRVSGTDGAVTPKLHSYDILVG